MALRWAAVLAFSCAGFAADPGAWVPARWPWGADAATLDLLRETPVDCLLVKSWTPGFAQAASKRAIALLAVAAPQDDVTGIARRAAADGLAGIVLDGDFPEGAAARARQAAPGLVVIELTARAGMKLYGAAPVVGTYQGVWPGVQALDGGAAKAAPTGSPWIDTNAGFLRAVRAWGPRMVWLGNLPPPKTIVTGERYLQAIADAGVEGGRWILALDDDFAARLLGREARAMEDWKRMGRLLRYFESHPEWRGMQPYGKLAIVEDPRSGALLSGGILDMLGARHTPVRAVPPERLTPDALRGASIAVNVEGGGLAAGGQDVLKGFARSGGTLLTPAGDGAARVQGNAITLDKADLDRLNDVWRDVQSLVGRRNLGVRLFNVSAMLSNLTVSPDGKQVVLHLVNYSSYPVENITVHLLGKFSRARLIAPDGAEKDLETYAVEEGTGVDVPRVAVCAALRLD